MQIHNFSVFTNKLRMLYGIHDYIMYMLSLNLHNRPILFLHFFVKVKFIFSDIGLYLEFQKVATDSAVDPVSPICTAQGLKISAWWHASGSSWDTDNTHTNVAVTMVI